MKALVAAALVLAMAGPVGAEALKCTMKVDQNRNGMIAPEIYLVDDAATGKLMVMDNVISYFNKDKPLAARITKDDAAKRMMNWSVLMVNSAGQRTKMDYHATLFRAENRLQVMARPNGFDNTFSAQGRCAPYQG